MKGIPVKILRGSLIGLELGASVGIGIGLGIYLDHWLNTSPWFSLVGLLVGLSAGIRNVMLVVRDMDDASHHTENDQTDHAHVTDSGQHDSGSGDHGENPPDNPAENGDSGDERP